MIFFIQDEYNVRYFRMLVQFQNIVLSNILTFQKIVLIIQHRSSILIVLRMFTTFYKIYVKICLRAVFIAIKETQRQSIPIKLINLLFKDNSYIKEKRTLRDQDTQAAQLVTSFLLQIGGNNMFMYIDICVSCYTYTNEQEW